MPTGPVQIRQALFPADEAAVRALIDEYLAWLDLDLSFQGLDHELEQLATVYGAPHGFMLLAHEHGAPVGCVGMKPFAPGTGELKRLYVRPACQGRGHGQALIAAALGMARQAGLERIVLDSAPKTMAAQRLYLQAGFTEIAPYYASPLAGTRYFALLLSKP